MSRMRLLNQLPAGQLNFEGFCLVRSCEVRTNVKGTPYLDMVLADCEGEANAKFWNYATEMGSFRPDDFVKIRGAITVYKDNEQLKIEKIRLAKKEDEVDMSLLIPCAPFDPEWMFDTLYTLAESFQNEDLRMLTQYLMRENKEAFLKYPAALKLHHATRGGLLHHCWTITRLIDGVCAVYPLLDRDLLHAGAILHDIGKIRELEVGALGLATAYTPEGQLIGHISIDSALIAETGHMLGISDEIIMLLQHMLLSHHGVAEFGSPKQPMFPEAEVLSELDLMDSRLYEMFSALENVKPGAFSERVWSLDNRMLYQKKLTEE